MSDLWKRIHLCYSENPSVANVATRLNCAESTIRKVLNRMENGEIKPRKVGRKKGQRKLLQPDIELLESICEQEDITTVHQLKSKFAEETGFEVGLANSTLYSVVHQWGSKKNPIYEHPLKWTEANEEYYWNYIAWRDSLPKEEMLSLKFHDEVRVEKNNRMPCVNEFLTFFEQIRVL